MLYVIFFSFVLKSVRYFKLVTIHYKITEIVYLGNP